MKCKIEIEMSNAAFEEAPGEELARIIEELTDSRLKFYDFRRSPEEFTGNLYDVNGNKVGGYEITGVY